MSTDDDAPREPAARPSSQVMPPLPPPSEPAPARYEPLSGRAKSIVIVLAVLIVADVVAVWSGVLELRLLDRLIAGEPVSDAEATGNDDRQAFVGIGQLILYLVAAVLFIRWLHLAYRNVDTIDPGERNHGTGWAIGGWFVPILSLWRPKQVVNDVWRAGTPPADPEDRSPGVLLAVWWLAFWVANILGQAAGRIGRSDDASTEDLRSGTIAYLASDSFDIVAAVLAILTVRAVTRRMESRAAGTHASVAAPWSTQPTN